MTAHVPPRGSFGWVTRSLWDQAVERDLDEIPRRLVAEPIMAWKLARLTADHVTGEAMFRPLSASGRYGPDEEATCRPVPGVTLPHHWSGIPPDHQAPHPRCACGFYARKERRGPNLGEAALRVSLTGTVIVHQDGYRAQRQQVIGVEIPNVCVWCRVPATRIEIPDPVDHLRRVGPVCDVCGDRTIGIADLAGMLGVDVTWCELDRSTFRVNLTASMTAWTHAMQQAMQQMSMAMDDVKDALDKSFADTPSHDDGPVHPLEAKRRRDEERRQRLEQLAVPRRPQRNGPRP